jgi:hypothetical protein
MSEMQRLELSQGRDELRVGLADAIDNAADQDCSTVLVEGGKPVAAIVPWNLIQEIERLVPWLKVL